jgi:hypothetical protein
MNFGDAIAALKNGHKVARSGWNGKGMWLILVDGSTLTQVREGSAYQKHVKIPATIKPHIDMHCADGEMLCGWLASQSDLTPAVSLAVLNPSGFEFVHNIKNGNQPGQWSWPPNS